VTRRAGPLQVAALLAGFAAAVLARVAVGGPGIAGSAGAGLLFAVCLVVLSATAPSPLRLTPRAVLLGLATAAVLCVPSLVGHALHPGVRPGGSYPYWASVVTVVAVAEEAFLRGALWTAVRDWRGETPALVVTAVAFMVLHLPLYGWGSAPLDLAVGLVLGVLRERTGGWAAPATAHVAADLAAWWLR
jgi:membrane protease YdiL (CAAX protease family)